jgi:hypothetical protein
LAGAGALIRDIGWILNAIRIYARRLSIRRRRPNFAAQDRSLISITGY